MTRNIDVVEEDSLEALGMILKRAIKRHGKLDDEIWDCASATEETEGDSETLFQSLNTLKSYKEALQKVRASLQRRLLSMQRQCRRLAFQEGIKRLPDEILVYIFEFGHRSTNYNDFALTVSRVCRRFRGVALTTPRLWTRLHVDPNCPDDFSRLEERFKDHGVDIWMSNKEEYEGPRFDEFANILKRYIPGACHLRIDGGLDVIDALDGDKPVLRRLKSIVHYNKANTYEDMNHTKNGICPICLSSKASTYCPCSA